MKEKIDSFMRLFVLCFAMIMGLFFTYAIVWVAIGLPLTSWAFALLIALALLSEFGYIKWVSA